MLLNVLGHVHLTRQQGTGQARPSSAGQSTVPVSGKAAALLTYLCLEGQAHHREHLAELLWDTPDPLRNLRVELARLKRDGVVHFPERQPMLSFQCPLDLTGWLAAASALPETQLLPWLAALRGLPLSGLEDLGSRQFQQWLDGQRWSISEQVERTLGGVHERFIREHRSGAAGYIQARAEQLGLRLSTPGVSEQSAAGQEWQCVWEEQALLSELMDRAGSVQQPQLVLLYGRGGSGKRSLIRQSVQGSGWQAVQLQASAQRTLFQEALAQQVWQLLPSAPPRPARAGNADAVLIELATSLQQSGLKLLIAVHNAARGLPWLPELARFLLDLPLPLILVLSETLPARLDAVRERTAFVDPHRNHSVQMTPLTPRMVLRAWQAQNDTLEADWAGGYRPGSFQPAAFQPGTTLPGTLLPDTLDRSGELYARAATLIQRSEGWPLHAQALSGKTDQHTLPETVRNALLSDLAVLPRTVRTALARLSLIHDRVTPEIADLLLEQDAPQVLRYAVQQDVLVPSAEREDILLPSLQHRSDDQTRCLQFASEALRIALAGSLTGLERQEVRQKLAQHFLDLNPALSLHHARKAGLLGLAEQAMRALQVQNQRAIPAPARPPADLIRAGAPVGLTPFRREIRTPNGYRVALDSGHLEVMRRGWYGVPPLLTLTAGDVQGGPWTLTARIDVFRGAPEFLTQTTAFALGPRVDHGPRIIYLAGGRSELYDHTSEDSADEEQQFGGVLPVGEWFTLRGVGRAGTLDIGVRALDVALTVAELRWGETLVLPAYP